MFEKLFKKGRFSQKQKKLKKLLRELRKVEGESDKYEKLDSKKHPYLHLQKIIYRQECDVLKSKVKFLRTMLGNRKKRKGNKK